LSLKIFEPLEQLGPIPTTFKDFAEYEMFWLHHFKREVAAFLQKSHQTEEAAKGRIPYWQGNLNITETKLKMKSIDPLAVEKLRENDLVLISSNPLTRDLNQSILSKDNILTIVTKRV
jgi:hypothetical protein